MTGKQIAIGAAAVVVAAGALAYSIMTQTGGDGPAQTPQELVSFDLGAPAFFVCEECGAASKGTQRPTPYACTKCSKEAVVESVRLKCGSCNKTLEAFRRRTVMSKDGKRPVGVETKTGDGAWQAGTPAPKCPGCGNTDSARLQPVLPSVF